MEGGHSCRGWSLRGKASTQRKAHSFPTPSWLVSAWLAARLAGRPPGESFPRHSVPPPPHRPFRAQRRQRAPPLAPLVDGTFRTLVDGTKERETTCLQRNTDRLRRERGRLPAAAHGSLGRHTARRGRGQRLQVQLRAGGAHAAGACTAPSSAAGRLHAAGRPAARLKGTPAAKLRRPAPSTSWPSHTRRCSLPGGATPASPTSPARAACRVPRARAPGCAPT